MEFVQIRRKTFSVFRRWLSSQELSTRFPHHHTGDFPLRAVNFFVVFRSITLKITSSLEFSPSSKLPIIMAPNLSYRSSPIVFGHYRTVVVYSSHLKMKKPFLPAIADHHHHLQLAHCSWLSGSLSTNNRRTTAEVTAAEPVSQLFYIY